MNLEELKRIRDRNAQALGLRPAIGQGTATTTVKVRDGLTCDIEDGQWRLIADEMPGNGGAGLGPDPGVLVRAGLGTCLAMGYVIWAAKLGIAIEGVEVTVDADYDARGMYGLDNGVHPGWGALRYTATISSPEPEERVRELIEIADQHSPILDDLRRALPVSGQLKLVQGAKE